MAGSYVIGNGIDGIAGDPDGGAGGVWFGDGDPAGASANGGAGGDGDGGTVGSHGANGSGGSGGAGSGVGSSGTTGGPDGPVNATIPLYMFHGTDPIVYISINGGAPVPVEIDTGSTGLTILSSAVPTDGLDDSVFSGSSGYAGTSTIISALPGALNQGVLIDEQNNQVVFGPNPLTPDLSLPGSPFVDTMVAINGGTPVAVSTSIDSGGVWGSIPQSLYPSLGIGSKLPEGNEISVYTADGQTLLYSYTTTATNGPVIVGSTSMNSGYFPFSENPIYIDYRPSGFGTTVIDR